MTAGVPPAASTQSLSASVAASAQSLNLIDLGILDNPNTDQSTNELYQSHLLSSDSVPIYLWNSRSIVNKLKQFNTFVHTSNYKIYGLTETWLSEHIYNTEIFHLIMLFIIKTGHPMVVVSYWQLT